MGLNAPALVVIYRWRVEPEHAEAFHKRLASATRELAIHGSFGSLLATAQDGIFHAIALWTDDQARERAFEQIAGGAAWPPAAAPDPIILNTVEYLWHLPNEKGGPVGPPS